MIRSITQLISGSVLHSTLCAVNPLLCIPAQASLDAKDGAKKALDSLSSYDDNDMGDGVFRDPTDPTKFFKEVGSDPVLMLLHVHAHCCLQHDPMDRTKLVKEVGCHSFS